MREKQLYLYICWNEFCLFPGDTHLAMFRVSKLEQMKPDGNQLGSEAETDGSGDNTEKP